MCGFGLLGLVCDLQLLNMGWFRTSVMVVFCRCMLGVGS